MTETSLERILLVEDNPADARLIREYVAELTWPSLDSPPTVHHVERLADAVETRDEETDVVLLDLGLPDSSRFATLEGMLAASGDEPVVVLTGLDDEQVGVEAVERGAQDFLVKDDLTPTLLGRTLRYAVERERQQQALQQRNDELALLNQIVRHDIRNDVMVITGWGDTLRDHVDQAGEPYLEQMLQASEHITDLTETVGDFLTVLEGDSEPPLRPIDLRATLEAEIEKVESGHPAATIALADAPADDVMVRATELLSSVVRNLLTNAVRHNNASQPTVRVGVETDDEAVVVRVADNGPGIPASQKDEIFGRGERGLESPGSGIGLYLVDTLVDAYGGEVRVEDRDSGERSGSVFVVTLKRA